MEKKFTITGDKGTANGHIMITGLTKVPERIYVIGYANGALVDKTSMTDMRLVLGYLEQLEKIILKRLHMITHSTYSDYKSLLDQLTERGYK